MHSDQPGRPDYVHGYTPRESERLVDQATALTEFLHSGTAFPAGGRVLEAGCGVGAQTVTLARNSPGAAITSIDISEESLAVARQRVEAAGLTNVVFERADIFDLPFPPQSFDHVFVCFVLEHLKDPGGALAALRAVTKPSGTLTVIEGDHGSTFFHPENADARRAIECLVRLQAEAGGDSLIGRRLYPMLVAAGLSHVCVAPKFVYADASRPDLVEGFTRNTFAAMVEGVREQALETGLIDAQTWNRGVAGLHRAAEPDGVFCYTFFKATGIN
ncbi:MAG: methyltransferase domain-containing protein [Thermoleophilia bacterium]|nr:methyltransferase domain-containing protein [Thermoleophilia bacterium]